MTSNINLTSPETIEKKSFTGKPALIFSSLLLVAMFVLLFALIFLKSRYVVQGKEIETEITQEQEKIKGPIFADVLDFQGKLNLLDKAIDDHGYWDTLLKKMGSYVIPEVRFENLSGERDSSGGGLIDIKGAATNLDALSRELILLKSFPDADSLEFKGASEKSGQSEGQSGVSFDASLKIKKSAFQK
jgi:hypothetical protein